ncbi:MAG: hypothetical protein O7D94_11880, partial [Planctomycetota bacterium]|nr:hypothetical protein [Planctomycetota bacterium]
SRQYTIRSMPTALDRLFRPKAERDNLGIREIVIHPLQRQLGWVAEGLGRADLNGRIANWRGNPESNTALATPDHEY